MTRDPTGRAEPVGHGEDLRAMNAELLRTADGLIESLTAGVARARLLIQENHRLRQEHRAIITAPYLTTAPPPRGPS